MELHIKEPETESFTLDLKKAKLRDPQEPEVEVEHKSTEEKPAKIKKKRDKKIKKVGKIKKRPTLRGNLSGWIWDKMKFLATTTAIFLIFFLALNWSAYFQIFQNYWQRATGQLDNSPLQQFVQEGAPAVEENAVIAASPFEIEHFEVPPIDIEVTPPGTRVIIPRINSNVPIVNVSEERLVNRDWAGLEQDIQQALRSGVVHYPGTPWPDQSGNVVVTGHSSYYPWDPGRFKDVFALLHQLKVGDEVIMFHNQRKYVYEVTDITVVLPTEVNVLGDTGDDRLTLITCTPIGTNLKRLIVTAKPVSNEQQESPSDK